MGHLNRDDAVKSSFEVDAQCAKIERVSARVDFACWAEQTKAFAVFMLRYAIYILGILYSLVRGYNPHACFVISLGFCG